MTSKEAVKLARKELLKQLFEEENNDCLVDIIVGLRQAVEDLEELEYIKKYFAEEAYKGMKEYLKNNN